MFAAFAAPDHYIRKPRLKSFKSLFQPLSVAATAAPAASAAATATAVTAKENKSDNDYPKALVILKKIAKTSHIRTSSFQI